MNPEIYYDVALSFSGVQRERVKEIAEALRQRGVRVFYDEFEQAKMWGKKLAIFLDEIYRKRSSFVLVFISKSYISNIWTRHEVSSALSRAVEEKKEYILPVRLDDTEAPFISADTCYIDLRKHSTQELVDLLIEKLVQAGVTINTQEDIEQQELETLRKQRRIFKSIETYRERLNFCKTLDEVIESTHSLLADAFDEAYGLIYLVDSSGSILIPSDASQKHIRQFAPLHLKPPNFSIGEGYTGMTATVDFIYQPYVETSYLESDKTARSACRRFWSSVTGTDARYFLGVAIKDMLQDRVVGVITLNGTRGMSFNEYSFEAVMRYPLEFVALILSGYISKGRITSIRLDSS